MELDPQAKNKLNKGIIQNLFLVKIRGIDLQDLNLKSCLRSIFNNLDNGYSKQKSIKCAIMENM